MVKVGTVKCFNLLTRRIAIANGTCVNCCNQPKAHFGLPQIRPWDNRGKCRMDEKTIQCLSNASQPPEFSDRSMYRSIFNRFPAIQPVSSKVRQFSTFFAHFGLPWVAYATPLGQSR